MSIFSELKRRNVFKVAGAYLALGWVVVQATATLAPAFHLPESALPLVTWIGAIGFPFVVLFSWIYELTPEGLKRESEIDRSHSITNLTSKRLDTIIIALLVVAIGLFLMQYFRPPAAATAPPVATGEGPGAPAALPAPVAVPAPVPAEAAPAPVPFDDKSIAVLPFVNMSEEASNEFFADGISEELLNLLAKIPELRVIARTSSFAFKGEKTDIAAVAAKLRVAHVLEGSVRRSGNRVRITAQLVRTSDSSHLWSETYDRTLNDIFAVQDEIAGAVVSQLRLTLLGEAPRARAVDPHAYAQFLQARQLGRQYTAGSLEQSNTLYQQALATDAAYADAWAGLAANYINLVGNGMRAADDGYRLAREAADKALAIDPDFAPAHAALWQITNASSGDLATATAHLERALALDPADLDLIVQAARHAISLGRFDTAMALQTYVLDRDPVNIYGHHTMGLVHVFAGRLDEAITSFRFALSLSPGRLTEHYSIGEALLRKGELPAALAEMEQEASEWKLVGMPLAYHALGRKADADAAVANLIETGGLRWSYNIAYVMAYRGDADGAFEWLDKAVEYRDAGLIDVAYEPMFVNLHADPRWLPFLRKLGKAPEQLAAIPFEVKLPQR